MVEKLNVDDSSRELAVDFNNEPIKKARKRKLYKIALRRIKNAAAFPFIFTMRTKGYDKKTAKWWLRSIYRDYRRSELKDYLEIFWAHRHGFRINTVRSYGINKDNYKDYMAEKEYYYISDINGIYKKWVSDNVSYRNILQPFAEYLPEQYYQFYKRDGKLLIIPLLDCPEGYKNTIYSVLRLIRREKSLDFVQCEGPKKVILSYRSKSYYINNKKATVREVAALINDTKGYYVLTEHVKVNSFINQNSSEAFHKLRITTINKYGNKPLISNASILSITTQEDREIKGYGKYIAKAVDVATGTIKGTYALVEGIITDISRETKEGESKLQLPFWEEITQETIRLCRYIPEIEYLGIDVVITPNSFKFIAFNNFPKYPRLVNFDKEIVEFLNYKVEEKKNKYRSFKANYEQGKKIVTNGFWKYRSAIFARKGYRPLTYRKWRRTLTTDLFSKNGISLKEKLWAYNHGFLS